MLFAPDTLAPCGAVLEAGGVLADDASAHARWRVLAHKMSVALGWPEAPLVVRPHTGGAQLGLRAPIDQLLVATDVNEWAWECAVGLIGPDGAARNPDYAAYDAIHGAAATFLAALAVFRERAAQQRSPALTALAQEAHARHLPLLQDDGLVTIGSGAGGRSWPLAQLPLVSEVPWAALSAVPAILVTGTNGKTTSVRLLAAIARRGGDTVGYCCTDGVFIGAEQCEAGDYSGPAGARAVLRAPETQFAVLEVARGGILRRGLALDMVPVALVTNVSAEHFGEYGIDSVEDLADAKLTVAQALGEQGTLVLNADDPVLLARALDVPCNLALFAQDIDHPALQAQRAMGAACCAVRDGRLLLFDGASSHDLGPIVAMPLTVHGSARYNIANCAGAALCAAAMGFAPALIATVLAEFGQSRLDNPGRLERWDLAGLTVLLDYAHNPEGLAGLLTVAQTLRCGGRMGLLLGQAGNRGDAAIADLAAAAALYRPDRIVLKEITGMLRGRESGAVPTLLHQQLLTSGMRAEQIETVLPEVDAACALLCWASPGDVLVLPVHDGTSRQRMQRILDALSASSWQPGAALPGFG